MATNSLWIISRPKTILACTHGNASGTVSNNSLSGVNRGTESYFFQDKKGELFEGGVIRGWEVIGGNAVITAKYKQKSKPVETIIIIAVVFNFLIYFSENRQQEH